jgi:hypothetical protein
MVVTLLSSWGPSFRNPYTLGKDLIFNFIEKNCPIITKLIHLVKLRVANELDI